MKTASDVINELSISMVAKFVPRETPAKESPRLQWRISLRRNGREFHAVDYSAGCAHSPEYKKNGGRVTLPVVLECETGIVYGTVWRPVPAPDVADVVASILLDASNTDERFEDWAANYGYDPDSRTAERMFNACRETAAALRRTFTADELAALEAAFIDY